MNKILLIATVAVICAAKVPHCQAAPAGPKQGELVTTNGFQFSIVADSEEFAINTPVVLKTYITNVTDKLLLMGLRSNPAEYQFEVKAENGELVPLTRYGKQIQRNKNTSFSNGERDYGPKESYEAGFVLNQIYDMTMPGTYTVVVSRAVSFPAEKESKQLISNTLHIKIS